MFILKNTCGQTARKGHWPNTWSWDYPTTYQVYCTVVLPSRYCEKSAYSLHVRTPGLQRTNSIRHALLVQTHVLLRFLPPFFGGSHLTSEVVLSFLPPFFGGSHLTSVTYFKGQVCRLWLNGDYQVKSTFTLNVCLGQRLKGGWQRSALLWREMKYYLNKFKL